MMARMRRTPTRAPTSRSQCARLPGRSRSTALHISWHSSWAMEAYTIRPRVAGVGGSAPKRGQGSRYRWACPRLPAGVDRTASDGLPYGARKALVPLVCAYTESPQGVRRLALKQNTQPNTGQRGQTQVRVSWQLSRSHLLGSERAIPAPRMSTSPTVSSAFLTQRVRAGLRRGRQQCCPEVPRQQ